MTVIGFTSGYFLTFVCPSGTELRVSLQVRGMAMREVDGKSIMGSPAPGSRPERWPKASSSRRHSDLNVI